MHTYDASALPSKTRTSWPLALALAAGALALAALAAQAEAATVFSEDFLVDPDLAGCWSTYRFANDPATEAVWDPTGYVSLTKPMASRGAVMVPCAPLPAGDWHMDYSFRVDVGDCCGADGIVVSLFKDLGYLPGGFEGGGALGLGPMGSGASPGYGVEVDNWFNPWDPSDRHLATIGADATDHRQAFSPFPQSEDGEWHDVRLDYCRGTLDVAVDGVHRLTDWGFDTTFMGWAFHSTEGTAGWHKQDIDAILLKDGELEAPVLSLAGMPTPTTATLAWTPVDGCGPMWYLLERDLDPAFPGPTLVYDGTGTIATDTGLEPCRTYHYRVLAYNAGNRSPWSNTVRATTAIAPPGAPSVTSVSWMAPLAAEVRWTAPGGHCPIDLYRIYRHDQVPLPAPLPGSDCVLPNGCLRGIVPNGTFSFVDQSLVPCMTYYYAVSADNAPSGGGEGPKSSPWFRYTHPAAIDTNPQDATVEGCSPCDLTASASGLVNVPPKSLAADPLCALRGAGGAVYNPPEWQLSPDNPVCGLHTNRDVLPEYFISSHGLDPLTGLPSADAACFTGAAWVPLPDAAVPRWQVAAGVFYHSGNSPWLKILPLSVPPVVPAGSVAQFYRNEGVYYVVGGVGPSCAGPPAGICADFEALDLSTGLWTALPDLPVPVAGAGVWNENGYIMVFGGRQCATPGACPPLDVVQTYDPWAGGWSVSSMPRGRSDMAVVEAPCKVLLIGGDDGGQSDSIDSYSLCTSAWLPPTFLPIGVTHAVAATIAYPVQTSPPLPPTFTNHSILCVTGGLHDGEPLFVTQRFDLYDHTWSVHADPLARPGLAQSHGLADTQTMYLANGPNDPLAATVVC